MPNRVANLNTSSANAQQDFVASTILRKLLRPLVRYCLRNTLTLQNMIEVAKSVFIELASEELDRSELKANASRICVMTGVHRKDIARVQKKGMTQTNQVSLISRVIAQWEQDARFLTARGQARILKHTPEASEFRDLVALVSTDVNPHAVLLELERAGLVERQGQRIKLLSNGFLLVSSEERALELLAQDSDDLALAVFENMDQQNTQRNLHARTEYDNIPTEALSAIRSWLLEQGTAFHKRVRDYLASYDLDVNPKAGTRGGAKVSFVTFSLTSNSKK